MALVLADRVQETTATTGTGTITLAGAVSGFQSFAAIGNGNTTYYTITSGSAWEVGIGTYTSSGTTLARTTILSSSAAGAAITLAGTSTVFATYPAERSVNLNTVGSLAIGGTAISTPAWTTSGVGLIQAATTYTDNSTAASGTVANAYINLFDNATYAATNTGVTVTSLYGTYFSLPAAGTNVTVTNPYAVAAEGLYVVSNGIFLVAGGASNSQISNSQSTGLVIVGSTSGTGTITLGRSTVSQTTNIQAGATAPGSTKTINIGTGGLSGSTTVITIGSTAAAGIVTINGSIKPLSVTAAPSAGTVTPASDASNQFNYDAITGAYTIAAPSGSPVDGQVLILRFRDTGTVATFTWNAIYRIIGTVLPTTTVAGKTTYVGCKYNAIGSGTSGIPVPKWDVIAVAQEA